MADFFKIPDTDLNLCPLGLGTSGAGLDWDGADADYLFDAYLDMGDATKRAGACGLCRVAPALFVA